MIHIAIEGSCHKDHTYQYGFCIVNFFRRYDLKYNLENTLNLELKSRSNQGATAKVVTRIECKI